MKNAHLLISVLFALALAQNALSAPIPFHPLHSVDSFRFYNDPRNAIHVRYGYEGTHTQPGPLRPVFGGAVMPGRGYHFMRAEDYHRFPENPFDWLSLAANSQHADSALKILQDISVHEALRRAHGDPDAVEQMLKVEDWLIPLQVSFFSGSERVGRARLLRDFGEVPKRAEKEPKSEFYRIRRASAWAISGNYFDGLALPLPAERVAGFKLDREHGWGLAEKPHLWEIGRAAQTTPNAFRQAVKQAGLQIYREAIASHLPPERALVIATAWDERHATLYRSVYKMKEAGSTPDGKKLFAAPIETLAKQMRLEDADPALSLLKRHHPEWSYYQALSFIYEARDLRRGSFGLLRMHKTSLKVELRDFTTRFSDQNTSMSEFIYQHGFEKFYLPEADLKLRKEIFSDDPFFYRPDDHFMDYSHVVMSQVRDSQFPSPRWRDFLRSHNTIELLLDMETATLDEVRAVAVQGLRLARFRLARLGYEDPDEALRYSGVHFAVSTPEGVLGPQLKRLALDQDYIYSSEATSPAAVFLDPGPNDGTVTVGMWGVVFPVEQLLKMEKDLESRDSLNPAEMDESRFIHWKLFGY